MTMTQRRSLSEDEAARLITLRDQATTADAEYRAAVVDARKRASIREIARVTGLALSTIQEWEKS